MAFVAISFLRPLLTKEHRFVLYFIASLVYIMHALVTVYVEGLIQIFPTQALVFLPGYCSVCAVYLETELNAESHIPQSSKLTRVPFVKVMSISKGYCLLGIHMRLYRPLCHGPIVGHN